MSASATRIAEFARERHDYDNDPYFYTAPIYRYNRGGAYYETNQYGADLLRQAVNNGYRKASGPAPPTAKTTGAATIETATPIRTRTTATTATTWTRRTTTTIFAKVFGAGTKTATTTATSMETSRMVRTASWVMCCR